MTILAEIVTNFPAIFWYAVKERGILKYTEKYPKGGCKEYLVVDTGTVYNI